MANPNPHPTLCDVVRTHALRTPDKLAITDLAESVSYAELDRRTNQVANALAGIGVVPGERIVYLGRNRLAFFELLFGLAKLGAVLAPLNWRLTAPEVHALVEDARARVVFVDPEFEDVFGDPPAPPVETLIVLGEPYRRLRDAAGATDTGRTPSPDDVVVQSYTSGTTALPKGVMLTHRNYDHARRVGDLLGITEHSVVMAAMPVFHVGGNVYGLFAACVGGTMVTTNTFQPHEITELIERYRVTTLNLAPTMIATLASAQEERPRDLSSLESIIYGGQSISEKVLARIRSVLTTPLIQCFGMTECTGAVTALMPEDHVESHLMSTGRAFDWVELAIFDPDSGRELGPAEVGELRVRSPQCTPGYWNRPEATAALFDADGWLRTGDAGYLDPEGYLYLTDRIKDMIITGGENVYPAEIENVLVEHPGVAEVAVVGTPDEKWGEVVTAFVVRAGGATVTGEQLIEWSRPRIAGFKRPRRVEIVTELPRNAGGKVLRRELRGRAVT
ncbi:MAG TPA: long-chain-fatty-acid--CoA ligase [Pseudonocardia sp.]|nr:long-chain-fatty-acid--CoA ligase [Pseudonocardia sp.]